MSKGVNAAIELRYAGAACPTAGVRALSGAINGVLIDTFARSVSEDQELPLARQRTAFSGLSHDAGRAGER